MRSREIQYKLQRFRHNQNKNEIVHITILEIDIDMYYGKTLFFTPAQLLHFLSLYLLLPCFIY